MNVSVGCYRALDNLSFNTQTPAPRPPSSEDGPWPKTTDLDV